LVSNIRQKEVLSDGSKYKQNLTNSVIFNAIILKIPFNEISSQTKLNEKKE